MISSIFSPVHPYFFFFCVVLISTGRAAGEAGHCQCRPLVYVSAQIRRLLAPRGDPPKKGPTGRRDRLPRVSLNVPA
ncbi:hypothetical protein QBC34DRAFT_398020 [Podospora aff. communis PSN243]|uniref:Secreted protein n=1 Tax=Podospora aff. communis PSN243 TaxID=3040156 RepID=A0AAV9H1C6_9PEZI|nr:hypothetical protein QBC34DRAFT_398020 [Podospora aff. communis PSN243]